MDKLLADILKEQMQMKGLTLERVRQLTGIADRYLSAFLEGEKERLPAAPYVRGYLIKIASVLDMNGGDLWSTYQNELAAKKSGPQDRLPYNRFALKKIDKRWTAVALVALFLIVYVAANAGRFLGKPKLVIMNPEVDTLVTTANTANLVGAINPADKLMIDGEEVAVDQNGKFQKEYALQPGLNRIEFIVKKLLGRENKAVKQIIYQPEEKL